MARLEADWLDEPASRAVVDALGRDEARFVGGAVRDSLLGRPVADIDLATRLPPDIATARLEAAGIRTVPTGIAHGTITAIALGRSFEVTTLRKDIETYGRHARVLFTDDWKADAARRDFTMNALYAEADGRLHDYFGGIEDALSGRVRFIGDAGQRISEDALRILRFFRFHAHFGKGPPDESGLSACRAAVSMLAILSIERVRNELLKLLAAEDPLPALVVCRDSGVLGHVLPEARADFEGPLAGLLRRERALAMPDPLRRLAVLIGDEASKLEETGRRLRLSNREIARLVAMAKPAPPDRLLLQAAYRDGEEAVRDRLLLADLPEAHLIALLARLAGWSRPRFPLGGRDLAKAGIAPGPDMGRRLARLEAIWVASDFTLGRAELLEHLARTVQGEGA